MENYNLIEKFLFPLLVSTIFIGVIMIIKIKISSMWIRCLITTVSMWDVNSATGVQFAQYVPDHGILGKQVG